MEVAASTLKSDVVASSQFARTDKKRPKKAGARVFLTFQEKTREETKKAGIGKKTSRPSRGWGQATRENFSGSHQGFRMPDEGGRESRRGGSNTNVRATPFDMHGQR